MIYVMAVTLLVTILYILKEYKYEQQRYAELMARRAELDLLLQQIRDNPLKGKRDDKT